MFRGLVILTLMGFLLMSYVYYRVDRQGESATSLKAKFEKSGIVRQIIPEKVFDKFSRRMPKTAMFLVRWDPKASSFAFYQWGLLIFFGWIYFCFLSPYPKRLNKFGWSRSDIFFRPLIVVLVLSLLATFISNHDILRSVIGAVVIAISSAIVVASLFSVPASVSIWFVKITKSFFESGRSDGFEKPMLPSPIVNRKSVDGVWYDE